MSTLNRKYSVLRKNISDLGSLLVAFSGGVDSSLLLRVARDVLRDEREQQTPLSLRGARSAACAKPPGSRLLAVTATSKTYPRHELASARRIAALVGARHLIVHTEQMTDRRFAANPENRCFYCKSELFRTLRLMAVQHGIEHVADATNADDLRDCRPGRKAAARFGIVSPLLDAGLTKMEVRALARSLGLPNWNEPAHACLASRIPYGVRITPAALNRIEDAEAFLASLGFTQIRVRDHWPTARIELPQSEIARALSERTRKRIVARLKRLGYIYVALDLAGYRTGSLNEVAARLGRRKNGLCLPQLHNGARRKNDAVTQRHGDAATRLYAVCPGVSVSPRHFPPDTEPRPQGG